MPSARHLVGVINHIRIHGNYEQALWASPSGRSLVVGGAGGGGGSSGPGYLASVGVLTGGHFKPIPWPGRKFAAAWWAAAEGPRGTGPKRPLRPF
jgi:hypothetical protein